MDEFERAKKEALLSIQERKQKPLPPQKYPLNNLEEENYTPPPQQDPLSFDCKKIGKVSFVLVCLAIILGIYGAYFRKPAFSTASHKPSKFDAFIMCREFTKKRLKAPSTADFASATDSTFTELDERTFKIASYVDAQNSFGAKLRNHFTCEVQYVGSSNWKLIDLAWGN